MPTICVNTWIVANQRLRRLGLPARYTSEQPIPIYGTSRCSRTRKFLREKSLCIPNRIQVMDLTAAFLKDFKVRLFYPKR